MAAFTPMTTTTNGWALDEGSKGKGDGGRDQTMKVSNMQIRVEICLDTPWFEEQNYTLLLDRKEMFIFFHLTMKVVMLRKGNLQN